VEPVDGGEEVGTDKRYGWDDRLQQAPPSALDHLNPAPDNREAR
jgi:hypothetical protein